MGFFSKLFGSKKTTTTTIPEPSAEELQARKIALQIADLQLDNMRAAGDVQGIFNTISQGLAGVIGDDLAGLIPREMEEAFTLDALLAADSALAAQPGLFQAELARVMQGPEATPRQRELIADIRARQQEIGESDIDRGFRDALETLREELTPALGLRPTDTPIVQRGERLAEEALRQKSQLSRELAAQAAGQELTFPLQAGALQSEQAGNLMKFGEAQRQFQQQLLTNAALQRQQFLAGGQQLGIGLTGIGVGTAPTLSGQLAQTRIASPTVTTTGRDSLFTNILRGVNVVSSAIAGFPNIGGGGGGGGGGTPNLLQLGYA